MSSSASRSMKDASNEKGAGASRKVARAVESHSSSDEEKPKMRFPTEVFHALNPKKVLSGDELEEAMEEVRKSPQLRVLWTSFVTIGEAGHQVRVPASVLVRARLMGDIDFKAFLNAVDPFVRNRVWKFRKPEGGAARRPKADEPESEDESEEENEGTGVEYEVDLSEEEDEKPAKAAPSSKKTPPKEVAKAAPAPKKETPAAAEKPAGFSEDERVHINKQAFDLIKRFRKTDMEDEDDTLEARVAAVKEFPQLAEVPDKYIRKFVMPSADPNWMGKFVASVAKYVPADLRKG
jgi:hypothetical protein